MNISDAIKKGTELLKDGSDLLKDGIKEGTDILQDKELRKETAKKALQTAAKITKSTAQTTVRAAGKTILNTMEYVEDNRLKPGAKDKYISELESRLAKKDHEIYMLKNRLRHEKWNGRRKKG